MNRRKFMKTAMTIAAGVSVGGIGAITGTAPVMDWTQYAPPRFKAGEPLKAGVMVYISADGRAYEAWMKRGLMSMAEFRKQVSAEHAALMAMEQHPEMLRFIAAK